MNGRDRVTQRNIGSHWCLSGFPVDIAKAAIALCDRRIAWLFGEGATLPVTRNPRVNDAWVFRLHLIRAESPTLHGTGPEVFDDHVCLSQQLKSEFPTAL